MNEPRLDDNDPAMIATALMESRQSREGYYEGDEDDTIHGTANDMTMNTNTLMGRPKLGERANTVGQSQEDLFLALASTDNSPASLPNVSVTREKNEVRTG